LYIRGTSRDTDSAALASMKTRIGFYQCIHGLSVGIGGVCVVGVPESHRYLLAFLGVLVALTTLGLFFLAKRVEQVEQRLDDQSQNKNSRQQQK
jgi:hypothetical protein